MDLVNTFKDFTLLGATWVLWLLVALSVLSVGIMIERGIYFWQRRIDTARLLAAARKAIAADDDGDLERIYQDSPAMPAMVALAGVRARGDGIDATAEVMNSAKVAGRSDAEKHLIVLGTLGNNTPFIGLFGTVLGIIKAFDELRQGGATTDNSELVMAGIAEALVATAIGLLVAIPAVVAFNFFTRRVRAQVTSTDEIAHAVLGAMYARAGSSGAPGGSTLEA
jgi:biopolymer transport protein ExbB